MENPSETPTEKRYREVCDMVNDRVGAVMKAMRSAGSVPGRLEENYGDFLCDLAEIQGILYKVCSAGVKKDRDGYLDILIEGFKEIRK